MTKAFTSENKLFDVIIIGAGPAGLSTALNLAEADPHLAARCLVLEKAHHPRRKLCAGGLTIDAELLLGRLNLDTAEIPHVDAGAVHLNYSGRGLVFRQLRGRTLRLIRRDEFDAWLTRKSLERGIKVKEGIEVKRVIPDADGVMVETGAGVFRARVVVGADGSKGIVRRCILPVRPQTSARLLEVMIPDQDGDRHETGNKSRSRTKQHPPADAYFDFLPVPKGIAGYTWDFPARLDGKRMRCLGIYDANLFAGERRPPLRSLLAEQMLRYGCRLEEHELQGHPIRLFDPFSELAVPRVLLAGDAAGAEALFGEGISVALGYGKVAAQAICRAFSSEDFSFRDYRRRLLASPLGLALLSRWCFAYLVYSLRWRWFQFLLWRMLKPLVALVASLLVINWAKRM